MQQPQKNEWAWVEPTSIAEALEFRERVIESVEGIALQLTQRKADVAGKSLSNADWHDYQQWRSKATTAKNHRTKLLRRINQWLRQNQQPTAMTPMAIPQNAEEETLLTRLYHVCRRMGMQLQWEIDAEAQQIIDMTREYLHTQETA